MYDEEISFLKDCSIDEMENVLSDLQNNSFVNINGNTYIMDKNTRDELEYLIKRIMGISRAIEETKYKKG